jgi:PAS domain S-box-containing protein
MKAKSKLRRTTPLSAESVPGSNICAPGKRAARSHIAEAALSATIDAAEDWIFVVDSGSFEIAAFNKAFGDAVYKARGFRPERGMRAEEIAPDRASHWNDFFRQVLEHGESAQEYCVKATKSTYHLTARPLLLDAQTRGICVFGHDITEQKRIEEALRKSEEKFCKAFRQGPISLTLSSMRDHRYLEVNEAFLQATGYTRDEVIGKTPFDIALWVRPEERIETVQELMSTGNVRNREVLYRTKEGEIRHGFGSATIIEINGEPCMLGVTHDITERKRAVEALREREEHLHLAIESGHMYAFEWDPVSDIVQRSKQSERILALEANQPHTERELLELFSPEDKEQYMNKLRSLTPDNPSFTSVFRLRRRDGNIFWLEKSGRAFFHPDGKIMKVVGIATDVTESRESERVLRELSGRLISTQEEERRRIARELHDHIGQELALLCVQAHRVASSKSDPDSPIHKEAQDLYRKIKSIATDVSKLSHQLHSTELDFLGLSVSAERLCRDFADQYGLILDFSSRSLPPKLDMNKARCLYRVLQEALRNIAKHSHATRINVGLEAVKGQLVLRVEDNGIGFDKNKTRFESGLGLVSIRERLNLVGGRFTLTSSSESGTKLVATVPIP